MKTSLSAQLGAVGALVLLAACGQEATTPETAPAPAPTAEAPVTPPMPSITPAEFVQNAANTDLFEIQASQLAATKASRAGVKDFARMMVTDHQATTRELTSLAPQVQLTAPTPVLSSAHESTMTDLRAKTGTDFDDAFIDAQVEAHENAVNMFQNFVNTAADGPLKQWAQTTLPKLQQHLEQARQLDSAT